MKALTVIGRRWFNKTFGNTYHSVIALVDGQEVVSIPYAYGYGNQWEWNALAALKARGLLPGVKEVESLWSYCERMGVIYTSTVTDVPRKKDL